jgi:integrase
VRLPGEADRKNYPLRLRGQSSALPETRAKSLAESIAWRIWEKTAKQNARSDDDATSAQTLEEVVAQFLCWADRAYRREDGTPTREATNCEIALRVLRGRYGTELLDNVGYENLLAARNELEQEVGKKGQPKYHRNTINQRAGVWKRFIRWALRNRLCLPQTKNEWWALDNLEYMRSMAKESKPVVGVLHKHVKATLPHLSRTAATMVQVAELCGARPGEIASMRFCDIERRREVWLYRPAQFKMKYRGHLRVIAIGPRAATMIEEYLNESSPDWKSSDPLFCPDDIPNRRVEIHSDKPVQSWQQCVRYAARSAGVPHWSLNQLRHACGTRVRRKFGKDAAQAVLGHAIQTITDRYTTQAIEQEMIRIIRPVMVAIG